MSELVAAVDAALAIEAGKFVVFQLGRPTLDRVLRRWFEDVDAPDVATAQQRLGGFLRGFDTKVRQTEDLPLEQLEAQFARPEVTRTLYGAFEAAMETDNPLKYDVLSDIILARLRAPSESIESLAARIAGERIRDVTPRQLRLLAFIELLNTDWSQGTWQTLPDDAVESYIAWLQHMAAPFEALEGEFADFSHLRGLGLVSFDDAQGAFTHSTTPRVLIPAFMRYPQLQTDQRIRTILRRLSDAASGDVRKASLAHVASLTLTPAGAVIAASALQGLTEPSFAVLPHAGAPA